MWGRITIHRTRRVVLERRRDPLSRVLRRSVPAHPGLDILLGFCKGRTNCRTVRLTHAVIFPNQRRQADGLRGIEGQIPASSVSHFFPGLGFDRVAMLDELLACLRVLPL